MESSENIQTDVDSDGSGDGPYLGTWKTREAAEEGVGNLQKLLDTQGNEVGTLRKQVDFFQKTVEDMNGQATRQPQKESAGRTNFTKEINDVQKLMESLDPVDEDYQKEMLSLVSKSNDLSAKKQHEETLAVAADLFKKELDERDTNAQHRDFHNNNPEFNTPEMQMQIQEYLNNDKTGMSNSLVAFREIQRDAAFVEKEEMSKKNAELERLLKLKKGEEATGRVVTKGHRTQQQKTNQPKATGAALNIGMQEVLDGLRG